jgi:glycosyltransferase involved in cell wall biosynthesis
MNILWVTNIPLPEASRLLGEQPIPFGGWLTNLSSLISDFNNVNLSIAFQRKGSNKVNVLKGEKIDYFSFPSISFNSSKTIEENMFLDEIINLSKPDIIHIFGTEYSHTLAMVNICIKRNIKFTISIQGLVSVIAKHYLTSIPKHVYDRYTFRDFVKQDNLKQQMMKFVRRGENEIEALKKSQNVIGRTTWDKACVFDINSKINYFHLNETLRSQFYNNKWEYEKCEKFSIFISQGSYPIKGLHFMLEALPLIIKEYPDSKLYIGGPNIIKNTTFKDKLKVTSYGRFIKKLINKYNLEEHVTFTGILNEEEMCKKFINANVFVSPSVMENESNSLSEAKILGVPCVASYVGGVTDRIVHGKDGFLYQHDAPYMLAHYVNQIFRNKELRNSISENARKSAMILHDRKENSTNLVDIYKKILSV